LLFGKALCTLICGVLEVDDDADSTRVEPPSIHWGTDNTDISSLPYKGFVLACNTTSGSSILAVRMPTFPGPCEVKGEIPLIYEISLTPILYINSLRACVCDTTVLRFNPPAEPARTVGAGGPDSRIRKPGSERTRERFD
jgi:hypothetical protein